MFGWLRRKKPAEPARPAGRLVGTYRGGCSVDGENRDYTLALYEQGRERVTKVYLSGKSSEGLEEGILRYFRSTAQGPEFIVWEAGGPPPSWLSLDLTGTTVAWNLREATDAED